MTIKTEINRAKALLYIYRYFGSNLAKLPRWSVGKATSAEINSWNNLQRTLKARYGLSAREVNSVVREASRKAK